jgi:hypothetical protein
MSQEKVHNAGYVDNWLDRCEFQLDECIQFHRKAEECLKNLLGHLRQGNVEYQQALRQAEMANSVETLLSSLEGSPIFSIAAKKHAPEKRRPIPEPRAASMPPPIPTMLRVVKSGETQRPEAAVRDARPTFRIPSRAGMRRLAMPVANGVHKLLAGFGLAAAITILAFAIFTNPVDADTAGMSLHTDAKLSTLP